MAWFAAAAPLISTAATTGLAIAQAVNARNASKYNAGLAATQAKEAQMQAAAEEEQQRREARTFMGRQRAAVAQSGVGPGTTDLLENQSAVLAELDALNIRYGGNMRGRGLLLEGASQRRSAGTAGLLAGGQVLYSASNLAKHYQHRRLVRD
jgi:hypothetical protein